LPMAAFISASQTLAALTKTSFAGERIARVAGGERPVP
jgi:hypothetical protein